MDLTSQSIQKWLTKNFEGSKIMELDMKSSEEFFLLCRCKYNAKTPQRFCKVFMQKLSKFTLTNWLVLTTFPSIQRMVFRKVYICQLSSNNKKKRTGNTKRNKDCTAKVDIRFKKVTRHTMKNDKLLKEGLSVIVKVNFHHSHSVRTLEAYGLLRCTPRTKKKYVEYFKMGLLPNEAKAYNEIHIRAKYYDPRQREIQLANGMINVSQSKVDHLYYYWRNRNRDYTADSFARLKEEKETFEVDGIYVKIIDNPKIIIVLTPLTKKVFSVHGDEIFVISSGCYGKEVSYLTSLFVPTNFGALPIGYILHDGRSEEEYEEGFKVFSASLCEFCDKPLRPKIVMTNDGEQIDELGRFFPRSTIELCSYVNYAEFWDFVCCRSNNVHEEDRKRLMTTYYDILGSQTKSACQNLLRELLDDPKVQNNAQLKSMVGKLWANREEWFPKTDSADLMLSQSQRDVRKLASTHMRIYREVVMRVLQKFSVYAIVDLLTGVMETMYKKYLTDFSLTGVRPPYPLFALFYDKPLNLNILPVSPNEYMVQSLKELDNVCNVYTDINFCTCETPSSGTWSMYCSHLCAVEYEFPFHPTPCVNQTERDFFFFPDITTDAAETLEADESDEDKLSTKNDNEQDETYLDMDEIKMETVPIETSDHDVDINEDESAEPIGLKSEVQRITGLLKTKKSKPIKKVLKTLKEAVSSTDDDEETQVASTSIREATSTQDEEAELVTKGWGLIYKRLPAQQKIFAKKAIDDILFEATLGTLGRNSVVINANGNAVDPFQVKDEMEEFDG